MTERFRVCEGILECVGKSRNELVPGILDQHELLQHNQGTVFKAKEYLQHFGVVVKYMDAFLRRTNMLITFNKALSGHSSNQQDPQPHSPYCEVEVGGRIHRPKEFQSSKQMNTWED